MHSDHPGVARVMAVHHALTHKRIAHRRVHQLRQLSHLFGRPGEHRAAAHVKEGSFGIADQGKCPVNILIGIFAGGWDGRRLSALKLTGIGRHVLGDIHQHRPRPSRPRNGKGPADRSRQIVHILHNIAVLGDGHGHPGDIHLLEGILSKQRKIHVTGDGHHGNRIHIRGGDPRHQIGRPRPAGSQAHAHLSRSPGIPVRGVGRPLLMGGQNMPDLPAVFIQSVIHIQDGSSRITKDGVHPLFLQTLHHDFRTCKLHTHSS